jgi:ParB family transcriptional regulator, chromosome partitioning protein
VEEAEKLQAELDAIQDDESGDYSEKRIDEIETRLEEIEAAQTEFTSEQKSRAGVIFTINQSGEPSYHHGLVERGIKASAENGDQMGNSSSEEDGFSAALLEDLTIQRTAALRTELAARPDIALVAVTHNLASQVFYEQFYSLPTALTGRSEAYTDRIDLRSAAESSAAKALAKQTEALRKHLPAKIDDLWQWLLERPQNVLLNILAVAAAHTVNTVHGPHDEPSTGRLGAAKALAQALELNMANWWQASAANYFGRVKKDQIVQAIQEGTKAPVDERVKALAGTRWLPEPLRM